MSLPPRPPAPRVSNATVMRAPPRPPAPNSRPPTPSTSRAPTPTPILTAPLPSTPTSPSPPSPPSTPPPPPYSVYPSAPPLFSSPFAPPPEAPPIKWAELARRGEYASICRHSARTMFLCCCWPIHKCVTVLACFDTLIVAYFAYKSMNLLADTIFEPHWTTVFAFVFCTLFLIVSLIGTVFVILAHKKQIARYCLPRLALIGGLLTCSVIAAVVFMCYFTGAQTSMNNFFFSVYQFFFPEAIDEREKTEIKKELRMYCIGFMILSIVYATYNAFVLALTRKYYQHLDQFTPVPQQEPTAPEFNPEFNGQKV